MARIGGVLEHLVEVDEAIGGLVGADPGVYCLPDLLFLWGVVARQRGALETIAKRRQRDTYEADAVIVGAVDDLLVPGHDIVCRWFRVGWRDRAFARPSDVVDAHHHHHGGHPWMAQHRHVEAAESVCAHTVCQHSVT